MTKEDLIVMAKKHNESIDTFTNVTLVKHFGRNKISLNEWFEAQRLLDEQNFYAKGKKILNALQNMGVPCKMDMQTNKLVNFE